MKLYISLSDAVNSLPRENKEVIAILSFNGAAYFAFRSTVAPAIAGMKYVNNKMFIGYELKNKKVMEAKDIQRAKKLYGFMADSGLFTLNNQSKHAEENLIQSFSTALTQFKSYFPGNKISKIDIFLTHSPCSTLGSKKHSNQCQVKDYFLSEGCEAKLLEFFKDGLFMKYNSSIFHYPKIKVYYNEKFDPLLRYDETFIKEGDLALKTILKTKKVKDYVKSPFADDMPSTFLMFRKNQEQPDQENTDKNDDVCAIWKNFS